jgi:hypothetical protein
MKIGNSMGKRMTVMDSLIADHKTALKVALEEIYARHDSAKLP